MIIDKYDKTVQFYGLSLAIPWAFWLAAAYLSRLPHSSRAALIAQSVLSLMGLLAPVFVAARFFLADRDLLDDLKARSLRLRGIPMVYGLLALFLIFAAMVLAQLISVAFGRSLSQFVVSGKPSFTSALFSPWLILVLAPIIEELAWHSYGTDTLRRTFNLFWTSMIFSLYWVVWHVPLSLISGYYHSNLVAQGPVYTLNFVFSLFVFVILMNWLYFKTRRNILIAVVFHLSANISNEIFATHPDSKVIQTVLLLIFAVAVMIKDRRMFFSREFRG
jgi:membrane protease YdiL (CAAX protease family)